MPIAKLMLLGLLSERELARSWQLRDNQLFELIETTVSLMREGAKGDEPLEENAIKLSQYLATLQKKYHPVSITVKKSDSADFVGYQDQPEQMQIPIKPPVLLAFSLIMAVKDPAKRGDVDTWLKFSTQALTGTHSVLKSTALVGVATVAGVSIAAGVNSVVGLIREYQYQRNETKRQELLQQTIIEVEEAYLNLHLAYEIVSKYYEEQMQLVNMISSSDPENELQKASAALSRFSAVGDNGVLQLPDEKSDEPIEVSISPKTI